MLTFALLTACPGEPPADGNPPAACDASVDTDGDGLDDCAEAELGTDASLADTDGDGLSDGDEVDCVSDPTDGDEVCYACGWPHGDPGDLVSEGAEVGDTLANFELVDQCGETVPTWDLAGSYHILFMTATWCGVCKQEALELPDRTADFASANDIAFSYVIGLFENDISQPTVAADAEAYHKTVGSPEVPVLADPDEGLLQHTPYTGSPLPGKCVLSPRLEILHCYTGDDDTEAFAMIEAHAAAR